MPLSDSAAERVAAALAERDAIQANLLELDGSFARQVLEGATLTGPTRQRWETASAALATLWETFLAYSAVVDRVAALGAGRSAPSRKDLPELTELLTEGCVQLPGAARPARAAGTWPPPAARRSPSRPRSAPCAGRSPQVTEVTSAVEAVWAAIGPPLDAATADLARGRPLVAGLGTMPRLESGGSADAESSARRCNADPRPGRRSRWRCGTTAAPTPRPPTGCGSRCRGARRPDRRARPAARAGAAPDRRAGGRRRRRSHGPPGRGRGLAARRRPRISRAAAAAARHRRAAAGQPGRARGRRPVEPAGGGARPVRGGPGRVRGRRPTDVRQAAAAALDKRDELRGLLRAYKAKAARLGAAEDAELAARYDQAYELLWTAPCDLAAAEAAVADYQRAILATEGTAMTAVACTQPGCGGTIEDGYCNVCGLAAPAPAARRAGGSGVGAAASTSATPARAPAGPAQWRLGGGLGGCAGQRRRRQRQLGQPGPGQRRVGSAGTGSRRGTRGSRPGSGRSSRGRLGAGLVEVPPVPSLDPATAVLANPQVPENRRFCGNCGQPVGQSRDGRPGLTEGFCPQLPHPVLLQPQAGARRTRRRAVRGARLPRARRPRLDLPGQGPQRQRPLGGAQGPAQHRGRRTRWRPPSPSGSSSPRSSTRTSSGSTTSSSTPAGATARPPATS